MSVEAFQQSDEIFRQVAENIREVLFVIAPDPPRMVYVSPVYEEVFGKQPRELYRRPHAWIKYIDPQDCDRVLSVFEESLRGAATDVEYGLIRPDGSVRRIRARSFPVKDAKGQFVRVLWIAEDVTASKNVIQDAPAANAAAEALNRAKSEFLAELDHEIRTAMNGIVGMTDLLLNTNVDSEQVEYLQMIKTSADSLLTNIKKRLQSLS